MTSSPTRRQDSWTVADLAWRTVCINMWGFAILGTVFFAVGLISHFTGWPELRADGVGATSGPTKYIAMGLGFGLLGNVFVWLQLSGRLKYGGAR